MAAKTASADREPKTFTCSLCHCAMDYHYFGNKPPFAKSLMLLEECYIMKDPFSTSGGLITIGGSCSCCGSIVCMDTDCSLFYSKRFCIPCVLKELDQFPAEIQQLNYSNYKEAWTRVKSLTWKWDVDSNSSNKTKDDRHYPIPRCVYRVHSVYMQRPKRF